MKTLWDKFVPEDQTVMKTMNIERFFSELQVNIQFKVEQATVTLRDTVMTVDCFRVAPKTDLVFFAVSMMMEAEFLGEYHYEEFEKGCEALKAETID